jgi:hypothetical protein
MKDNLDLLMIGGAAVVALIWGYIVKTNRLHKKAPLEVQSSFAFSIPTEKHGKEEDRPTHLPSVKLRQI